MAEKDYYKVLGVGRDASKEEIKKAYKKLAKKHHPDINKDPGTQDRFKEINEAASVLGDDRKREQFDRFGSTAENMGGFSGFDPRDFGGGAGGGDIFGDIFDQFFGSGFSGFHRQQSNRATKGADLTFDMEITLEEAHAGLKKKVKIPRSVSCPDCKGKGGHDFSTCNECNGNGMIRRQQRTPFGIMQTQGICPTCNGERESPSRRCEECDGTGFIHEMKELEIVIPAGIENRTRLRLTGMGEAGMRQGQSGDLYVNVFVLQHEIFERSGNDLHIDIPITFVQAAMGDEIDIPTIEGKAKLKIPQGTQTHTLLRMKGKGMPAMEGYGTGDQMVRVIVHVPEKLTQRQKDSLKAFARISGDKLNPGRGFFERLKEKL